MELTVDLFAPQTASIFSPASSITSIVSSPLSTSSVHSTCFTFDQCAYVPTHFQVSHKGLYEPCSNSMMVEPPTYPIRGSISSPSSLPSWLSQGSGSDDIKIESSEDDHSVIDSALPSTGYKPKVAPGWKLVCGNMYQMISGPHMHVKHICDFTCDQKVWRDDLCFFVCAISGRPSRSFYNRDAHKRSSSSIPMDPSLAGHRHKRRF